ncbi:hypothetical protein CBR_g18705 [Chara braunii]|uniref:LRAT domain-containing protein n=1 Tax=Chara braunii TaxID=69332 RepID=A0A388KW67_CHABU|nr:hypothetical protein CBR_g18705 [Chara braunii]|eukprot:GBG74294.1 hypothetical protein CBR_g18705 [Chara braunii]
MTLLSNRVHPADLKPGDHIYTWRSCYAYTYHGIYVGKDEVVFFNGFMHNLHISQLHRIHSISAGTVHSSSTPLRISAPTPPHSDPSMVIKPLCPSAAVSAASSLISSSGMRSPVVSLCNSLPPMPATQVETAAPAVPAVPATPVASADALLVPCVAASLAGDPSIRASTLCTAVPAVPATPVASADALSVPCVAASLAGDPSIRASTLCTTDMSPTRSTSLDSSPTSRDAHHLVLAEQSTCSQPNTEPVARNEQDACCDNAMHEIAALMKGSVVRSNLVQFLLGGELYRYQYGVARLAKVVKLRGTCTMAQSDPAEAVLHRAKYLLQHPFGFGPYDPLRNNSEDFALYCKTGLVFLPDPAAEGEKQAHAGGMVAVLKKAALAAINGTIAAVHSLSVSEAIALFVLHSSKEFVAKEGQHHAKNCTQASAAISTIATVAYGVEHPISIPFTLAKFLLEVREEYILKHGIECLPSTDDTVHQPILLSGRLSGSVPPVVGTGAETSDTSVKGEPLQRSPSFSQQWTTFFDFALDRAKEVLEASADGCGTSIRSSEADAAISAIAALKSSHTLLEAYISLQLRGGGGGGGSIGFVYGDGSQERVDSSLIDRAEGERERHALLQKRMMYVREPDRAAALDSQQAGCSRAAATAAGGGAAAAAGASGTATSTGKNKMICNRPTALPLMTTPPGDAGRGSAKPAFVVVEDDSKPDLRDLLYDSLETEPTLLKPPPFRR